MYPEDRAYEENRVGIAKQALRNAGATAQDLSPFDAALEEQRVALAAAHNELAHLQRKLANFMRPRPEQEVTDKEPLAEVPVLDRIRALTNSARTLGAELAEISRSLVV